MTPERRRAGRRVRKMRRMSKASGLPVGYLFIGPADVRQEWPPEQSWPAGWVEMKPGDSLVMWPEGEDRIGVSEVLTPLTITAVRKVEELPWWAR